MEIPSVSIHKRLTAMMLAIAVIAPTLIASSTRTVSAADPVAVISINQVDELLADVDYIMQATGTAGFGQLFLPQIKTYLQGLDTKKPIGLTVSIEAGQPKPLAFLPVKDLDSFLSHVKDHLGEASDAGDGVLELQGPKPVFVKQQNGWAFVGQDAESLSNLPDDPQKLLNGLHGKYDIAIRAFVQNIPQQYRELAIGKMSEAMEQGLQNAEDEASADVAKAQLAEIKKTIEQADQLTLGWNIDSAAKQTYFDFSMTAKPGSELADRFNALKNIKTKYAGFIVPEAAISGGFVGVIKGDQVSTTIQSINALEKSAMNEVDKDTDIDDDQTRENAKKLITAAFDILRDAIKTGKVESAGSIVLQDKAMTLGIAAHVADAKKVESVVQEFVKLAKAEPEVSFSKVKFNAGQHGDVRIHELAVPIPGDEYIGEVLGGELEICIGAATNDVYITLGTNPVESLKKMIDKSKSTGAKEIQPFSVTVKLTPILKFAEAIDKNVQVGSIVRMLEGSGHDHIRITASTLDNGSQYRFLVEDGVLKAIGQAAQMQMSNGF
jgi:hypothetical protein